MRARLPTEITVLTAGTCNLTANQAAGETYSAAPQVTTNITVNKATQTTTFAALADKTTTDAPFAISATASSGLAVSLTAATPGVCTALNGTVTLLSVGTCTINTDQAGNAGYAAAATVTHSFAVAQAQAKLYYVKLKGSATIILRYHP